MKSYKNVELFAKNAPTGSYAAGCPTHHKERYDSSHYRVIDSDGRIHYECDYGDMCNYCELAH